MDAVRAYDLSIPNYLKYGTYNKRLAAAKKVVEEWSQRSAPEDFPATLFHLKTIKERKRPTIRFTQTVSITLIRS